jgi:long-chain acyl-CoA synthetase
MPSAGFQTLNELFLGAIEQRPRPDAFLSRHEKGYVGLSSIYALQKAAALSVALERLGLRRGDRIAILSENRVEWPLTDYAAMGMGAVDVPIYPTLPAEEVEYILRDSGSRAVVVSTAGQLQKILEIRSHLPDLLFVLVMDQVNTEARGVYSWSYAVQDALSQTLDPERDFRTRALEARPEDTATILYTSGTTGKPKGVRLTHANIASNVQACTPLFHFRQEDRAISFLPLSHIFERMLEYCVFWHGVAIAYAESFESLAQNIVEVRPTLMAVVPRVLEKLHGKILERVREGSGLRQKLFHWGLQAGWEYVSREIEGRKPSLSLRLKHAAADKLVASKIRARLGGRVRLMISGSAPLAPDLARFFFAVGLPVYEGYGLTETSPVIAVNAPGTVRIGTVGKVISGVEVTLGEESLGIEGGAGREILVRGPNVSPGYYHQDEENQQAFAAGWFHTGDLGILDSEGFLTITGRKKNLLKTSGGKYISPEKIEGLFQGHPLVAQILVLGDSRRFVSALIVPHFERLEALARERRLTFATREDLVALPEVGALVQEQVDETCARLAPFERIRQIALLPREFSIDAGDLSLTLKVRRFVAEERWRDVIEEIYSRPSPEARAGESPG